MPEGIRMCDWEKAGTCERSSQQQYARHPQVARALRLESYCYYEARVIVTLSEAPWQPAGNPSLPGLGALMHLSGVWTRVTCRSRNKLQQVRLQITPCRSSVQVSSTILLGIQRHYFGTTPLLRWYHIAIACQHNSKECKPSMLLEEWSEGQTPC